METGHKPRITPLIAFIIVSLAVVGYFTGLQAPMPSDANDPASTNADKLFEPPPAENTNVIPAAEYLAIGELNARRASRNRLTNLQSNIDRLAKVNIKPGDKLAALARRDRNRAYNGAPPTIPHPIEQRSDASCVACHQQGAKTATLRIPPMSHRFLANCTQCHVESNPKHLPAFVFRENDFQGLAAPRQGPRAFHGAPPQIPHTTWMRSNCMSCHGYASLQGIRTTHPWRTNCQQCHTSSAASDQIELTTEPKFLPGPRIKK